MNRGGAVLRAYFALLVLLAVVIGGCGGAGRQDSAKVNQARATADAILRNANATASAVSAAVSKRATTVAQVPTATIPPTRTPQPTETPAPTATPVPTDVPPTATPTPLPPTPTPPPPTPAPQPTATVTTGPSEDKLQRATVQIVIKSDDGDTITGSGSIVSKDGLILSNAHVVYDHDEERFYNSDGEATIRVTTDPREPAEDTYVARIVQMDPDVDVSVLKVTGRVDGEPLPAGFKLNDVFKLADSDRVKIGDPLRVFGFPGIGGDSVTFTSGVISGFRPLDEVSLIKTDAQFSYGSSGGAALDEAGELVGIPTAGIVDEAGRVGYVVPVNSAKPLIKKAAGGDEIALNPEPVATPTEEPDPSPTATPAPGDGEGVEVLSDNSFEDDIHYTHVVGEVRNDTGGPVEFVRINATFYDKAGKVVGTDFTYTSLDTVPRGGKSPFEVIAEVEETFDRYSLAVEWDEADAEAPGGLKVLSSSDFEDDLDFYHIVGEVKNTSQGRLKFVKVIATLYDKAGDVVGTDYTYTSPENLNAGQKAPFELTFLQGKPSGSTYRLQVQGEE